MRAEIKEAGERLKVLLTYALLPGGWENMHVLAGSIHLQEERDGLQVKNLGGGGGYYCAILLYALLSWASCVHV